MDFKKDNKHMVDVIFVVVLFCGFAFCALMLVIMGADVYKKTVASMDANYIERTSYAYLSEKVRQKDVSGAVHIGQFGDGDALFLKEELGGREFYTCLYVDDGYLKELFTANPEQLGPAAGQKIYACDSLVIIWEKDNLLHITVQAEGATNEIYASVRSGGEV